MKSLDDLLPRILPRVPKCPEPIALDALRTAAIRFCEATRLWRESDSFDVTTSSFNVVAAPYGAELFEIEHARFDGKTLEPASISWLDDEVPDWRTAEGAGPPSWITQAEPNSVIVVPLSEGKLDLAIILKPSYAASQLPNWMVDSHAMVLADGALAEIYAVPGQDFYSPDLAGFHTQKFQGQLDRLAGRYIKGQQRAPSRTKPRFF